MQLTTYTTFVVVALASLMEVTADHQLQFHNKCKEKITPKWKNGNTTKVSSGPAITPGGSYTATVPEKWIDARVYGQNGKCTEPDGVNCTQFECSFPGNGFDQCNLSLLSGFNVGMSFSWIGGKNCQPGKSCPSPSCPDTQAFQGPTEECPACESHCNTPNVGMSITFCP